MNASVIRQLNMTRGVKALKVASFMGSENLFKDAIKYGVESGDCQKGDNVICLSGQSEESPENLNILKISIV
jgi:pyruvate kinase